MIGQLKGKGYWMYAPTHVNVWAARGIRALASAAGLSVSCTFTGTEASFRSWLATRRRGRLWGVAREVLLFVFRKARLFGWSAGADTVYYLREPSAESQGRDA
jgi:hypothetical protein